MKILYKYIIQTGRVINMLKGSLLGNAVKAYWFTNQPNFGDLLTPALLRCYGLCPILTTRQSANALIVGSILDKQSENYSGYIVGSGLKYDIYKSFPHAKILAVRGELTRERIGACKSTPLGDPGLLVPLILKKRKTKKYVLGLVPHFFDKQDKRLNNIYLSNMKDILLIDVQRNPKKVISDIDSCEFILSSSLHGLVVAEALGIPNGWILLSEKVQGSGFKFYDYASAIRKEIGPNSLLGDENLSDLIKMTLICSEWTNEIQLQLDSVFRGFSKEIIDKKKRSSA